MLNAYKPNIAKSVYDKLSKFKIKYYATKAEDNNDVGQDEFRVLNLRQVRFQQKRRVFKKEPVSSPRTQQMPIDQEWGNVWPGPRSFQPSSVPLSIRQGYTPKGTPAPGKFANAELMKIPNFLHLTPPVIQKQCAALKQFCTKWPTELKTEKDIKEHFPIEVISSDYCHGLPTVRNPLSRIVSLKIDISVLPLDDHAKDKLLRLVGERYDPETNILTITADRCPVKKQNYDYTQYLLTALFHESWMREPWEDLKTEADMERYYFDRNITKTLTENILNWNLTEKVNNPPAKFVDSVENLMNDGENEYNLGQYKDSVMEMLNLKS